MGEKKRQIRRDRAFWSMQVNSWTASGLSQTDYCRENKLNPRSLSGWNRRLGRTIEKAAFVEVHSALAKLSEGAHYMELVIGGIRLLIREEMEAGKLRSIVVALGGI